MQKLKMKLRQLVFYINNSKVNSYTPYTILFYQSTCEQQNKLFLT